MTVRRYLQRMLVPFLIWGGSMAAYAASRGVPAAAPWAAMLAALALLSAIGATVALALRKAPVGLRQSIPEIVGLATIPALLLIAASGGIESPAALLPAFFVLFVASRHGLHTGALASAAAAVLLLGAEYAASGAIDAARAASLVGLIAAAGVIPVWLARRTDSEVGVARQRMARVEGYLADRRLTPSGTRAQAADLRFDAQEARQGAETVRDLEELDRYLRDIRDASGADEVVFWRWDPLKSTQKPAAWSTEGATMPLYFSDEWAPLVKWAAEGEMSQCVESEGVAYFIAGPVKGKRGLYGTLAISSRAGLTLAPDGAREWLVRYSVQVGLLVELLDGRRDFGRHRLQTKALLSAADGFRAHTTSVELGKAICQAAIDVTSATRSTLVRWDADAHTGVVQATAGSIRLPESMPVLATSFVGERCREGQMVTKSDARTLAFNDPKVPSSPSMLNPVEGYRVIGSFSVAPMKIDARVIGALVVEGKGSGEITLAEGRNLTLLAALAASFLEAAWRIERADKHARTDQLTGLWNRGHFDESMVRVLKETDRFGPPSSLILADIDHFKSVNDTYGHEAGDAVLRRVAETFMKELRTVDICARYGGEEIAILLPQTALDGARQTAERLRAALEKRSLYHGGRQIQVTASFGVATYPEAVATHEGLLPAADRALYQAKHDGRNRVKAAEPTRGRKHT